MPDDFDWSLTTWDGLRRQQMREFRALPLREKVARLEQMAEVTAWCAERRRAREVTAASQAAAGRPLPPAV